METNYIRCSECGYVYDSTLDKCPRCEAESKVYEDYIHEALFNICD